MTMVEPGEVTPRRRVDASANDPRLRVLLDAEGEAERSAAVERILVTIATPVIDAVIRQKSGRLGRTARFQPQDEEDIRAAAMYRIVRRVMADLHAHPIAALDEYFAAVALHACDDYLREQSPERASLRRHLIVLLRADPRFACWTYEKRLVCGRAAWQGRSPQFVPRRVAERAAQESDDLAGAIAAVIAKTELPLLLSDVVAALAPRFAPRPVARASGGSDSTPWLDLHRRDVLARVWEEIRLLPVEQRAALLLNLRDIDGRTALVYFPLTGVATVREIAAVLSMSAEHLARLWKDLPMRDSEIGQQLGITRQRVINLRQAARKRLGRRLGAMQ